MTEPSRLACRILKLAEEDLSIVIKSLVAAEPERVQTAQLLLEHLVGTLGELEASVRQTPNLFLRESLNTFRVGLSQAKALITIALTQVNRQVERTGLAPGAEQFSLQLEA